MLFIKGSISYSKEVIKNPWIGICYCATHLGFLTSNAVYSKATFHIVQQAEILTSLFNGDDIYIVQGKEYKAFITLGVTLQHENHNSILIAKMKFSIG